MKKYIQPTIKIRKANHVRMICASDPKVFGCGTDASQLGKERDDAYDEYNNYDNENLW